MGRVRGCGKWPALIAASLLCCLVTATCLAQQPKTASKGPLEGFFALLKRAVYGQFHHVSEAHLHRYLAEADFKYNTLSKMILHAPTPCYGVSKASGFCIDSLTKPRTPKQKARAFLRWRASLESE